MKHYHYIVLAIIVAAGLSASFWLLPRKQEIALMYFKGHQLEAARRASQVQASGPLSISDAKLRSELYLALGDVDQAVSLLERFVSQNPGNLDALRRLGTYYQYAQRPTDYILTLEKIAASQPSEAVLRELSEIYNFTARYEKQIAALEILLEHYPKNPKDFLDLAGLQATRGVKADAVTTLQRFESRYPRAITASTVELLVSLLLDNGRAEEAYTRASSWLSQQPNTETAARFADLFHFKGQPAPALRLLQPFEKFADNDPYLLAELIQVQIANGLSEAAFDRLKRLDSEKRLPDDLFESFIDLLLTRNETALAIRAVQERGFSLLPGWLLANLADATVAAHRADFAQQMVAVVGEEFLASHPVLAGELALLRGDQGAAGRWITIAERAHLPIEQKVALAELYDRVGRQQDAFDLLVRLAPLDETPEAALTDLAQRYLKLRRAKEGLVLFEKLRSSRPSSKFYPGWALLAAGIGEGKAVRAWLDTADGKKAGNQLLTDLYYLANESSEPTLALATAERLYGNRGGGNERLLLAKALVAAGRPSDALPHLRVLLPGGSDEETAYAEALSAALVKGAPVGEELHKFWAQKLVEPGLTDTRREEAVYALLDLKAYSTVLPTLAEWARRKGDPWFSGYLEAAVQAGRKNELIAFLQKELDRTDLSQETKETRLYALMDQGADGAALPYLRRFAETYGDNWVFAYEDALRKLGRREELLAFWKVHAARAGLPNSERRSMVDRMLEEGQKGLAEKALLELARDAPPESRDVSQLLFLWGPRPAPPALNWLEARARSSSGAERAAWMNHLTNAGAPRRAIAVMAGQEPPTRSALLDAYLDALVSAHDGTALSTVLDRTVSLENDPQRLRRFSRLALELEQNTVARKVYSKLLSLAPRDPEALRRMGALAFSAADYSAAKSYLASYLSLGEGDYESNYYYGELLIREKGRVAARIYYGRALRQIERSSQTAFAPRVTRALLLHRMGRTEESLAAFETLLKERPKDKNLRADYVTILLDQGRREAARRVLSMQ